MTINDLYKLLSDAVRYAPLNSDKYQMLQTFAVLRYREELNDANLQKNIYYKGTNYFYSRRWEGLKFNASKVSFDYPLLAVFPISGELENPLGNKLPNIETYLELNFLYPNVRKAEKSDLKCTPLLVEDIYALMSSLSLSVFRFIQRGVLATTNTNATPTWYNEDLLIAAQAAGTITGYTADTQATNQYRSWLRRENESMQMNFVDDIGADNLCGVKYKMKFMNQDCDINTNFNFTDISSCCTEWDGKQNI